MNKNTVRLLFSFNSQKPIFTSTKLNDVDFLFRMFCLSFIHSMIFFKSLHLISWWNNHKKTPVQTTLEFFSHKPCYLGDVGSDLPSDLWVSRSCWSWFCNVTRSTVCLKENIKLLKTLFSKIKAVSGCSKGKMIAFIQHHLREESPVHL